MNENTLGMKKQCSILLVEDNPVTMMSLRLYFEDVDYDVLKEVSFGEEVPQAVRDTNPDVVVLDIMLKGELDGIQAAGMIRESSDVPILFVSALSDKQTLSRMKSITHSSYVTKPYDYELLKDELDKLIQFK